MYHACLYCARELGRNDVLEALPIGRRIAFDAQQGRLWVICMACARWNLVPFDTRLEAIDCAESLFRDSRTRYSTANIGLARMRDGTDLIRIGPALRPEFAAWRYGTAARHRRRSAARRDTDPMGLLNWFVSALAGGPFAALPLRDVTLGAMRALTQHGTLRDPWTDKLVDVPYLAMMQAVLTADDNGGWRLVLPYRTPRDVSRSVIESIRDVPTWGLFSGPALLPALARVLPALDSAPPSAPVVDEAVRLLDTAGDERRLMEYVIGRPLRLATQREYLLREAAGEVRLALEMLANEETERRAMEGELRLLERQWRDAEAVAAIADQLALEH